MDILRPRFLIILLAMCTFLASLGSLLYASTQHGRPKLEADRQRHSDEELRDVQSSHHTTPHQPEPTAPGTRSFVLAESYWEEMTMATHNFMGLVMFAKHWSASAVWPFTDRSYLYGLKESYTWDLLYDLDDVKRKCAEMSLPAPVHFEEFLKEASRRVVFITIDWNHGEGANGCNGKDMETTINILNTKLAAVDRHLPHFRQESCCVVNSRQLVNGIVEIAEKCRLEVDQGFTVIFKQWRGTTYDSKQSYRVSVPYSSATTFPVNFNHSKWVIGNATLFLKDITRGTAKCIAVHVRAEVLFIDNSINECITNLNKISKSLKKNYTDMPLLVFGDEELSRPQIQSKISHGLIVRFNPKKYRAVVDRGFSAQVEQRTMSLCQILVLVGRGSFQGRTLARFNTEPTHLFSVRACGGQ